MVPTYVVYKIKQSITLAFREQRHFLDILQTFLLFHTDCHSYYALQNMQSNTNLTFNSSFDEQIYLISIKWHKLKLTLQVSRKLKITGGSLVHRSLYIILKHATRDAFPRASDLGLGGGFRRVLRFPPLLTTG